MGPLLVVAQLATFVYLMWVSPLVTPGDRHISIITYYTPIFYSFFMYNFMKFQKLFLLFQIPCVFIPALSQEH